MNRRLATALTLLALLALAPSAQAAITHNYTGTSFGPDGVGGSASFENLQSLAIDQASGDLYAYDAGAGKLYKFTAAGAPANFSSTATNAIEGLGGGGGQGEYQVAVAPPGSPAGTAGDIYLANNSNSLLIYSPAGEELDEIALGEETCGVAVDPAGHLFIGTYATGEASAVHEYVPTADPPTTADLTATSTAGLPEICNVAADGAGGIYAANFGGQKIAKLEGITDPEATLIEPGAASLATDPASDDLYADRGEAIAQFGAAGNLLGTFGSAQLSGSHGVAATSGGTQVYASTGAGQIAIFGPPLHIPAVTPEAATGALGTEATLNAAVNPDGLPLTECVFQYTTAAAFAEEGFEGAPSAPCEGEVPADTEPHHVSAHLTGLTTFSVYRWRILAANANGSAQSEPQSFSLYAAPPALGPCPANEAFRTGPSAPLPDCRAYEQASPVDKNGGDVGGKAGSVQASTNGNAITYFSLAGVPGGVGSQNYPSFLARRGDGEAAWSTQGLLPPASLGGLAGIGGWTPDLSQVFLNVAEPGGSGKTFLSRDSATGALTPIFGPTNEGGTFVAASADGSRVFFESEAAPLAPGATPGKRNLYLWDRETDQVSLAGALPDSQCATPPCAPAEGASVLAEYAGESHAVSSDGSSVYFTEYGGNPQLRQLYLRGGIGTPSPETLQVSTSERAVPDPAGTRAATFQAASTDGTKALFTSAQKLTDDATTGPETGEPEIGRATIGAGGPEDLRPEFLPAKAGGIAVDGSHVYWAEPSLGAIGRATLGPSGPEEVEEEFLQVGGRPRWVAVDGQYAYWSDPGAGEEAGEGMIGRARLDRSQTPEPSFIAGASQPQGLAVNSEFIYWANDGTHAIARAEISGTNPEPSWRDIGPGEVPQGVAVNASNVYWSTNNGGASFISRAALDGSGEIFLAISQGNQPSKLRGIALDGSHVYWVSQASRTIGRADLDLTEASREPEYIPGVGFVKGLAIEGSHLYWSTNGEIEPNPGNDLYRFDADAPIGQRLTDLTVDHEAADPNGAEVLGVLGASDDASYVYFVATGGLSGEEENANGEEAESGQPNLYLWHEGTISFIARLVIEGFFPDTTDWRADPHGDPDSEKTSRVSATGTTLLFRSQRRLTAYDNEGRIELYRYQVGDPGPTCVSCNPVGAPPFGAVSLERIPAGFPAIVGARGLETRNLSADGDRVVFETPDKLVPADTDGDAGCPDVGVNTSAYLVPSCLDVYEWEAPGSGSCTAASSAYAPPDGGCLYLISAGTGKEPSFFADADASGDSAFIFTRDQLVPQDGDHILDLYDARVDGGLASQHQSPPPACEGDSCRGAGSLASPASSAATVATGASGNLPPKHCRKGRHLRRGRCVARHHKHGRHKKRRHTTKHRNADHHRRTSR
jgi:hypothetical protein